MQAEHISQIHFDLFGLGDRGTGVMDVWQDKSPGFRVLQVTLLLESGEEVKSNSVRCSVRDSEALKEMTFALFSKVV